MEIGLIKQAVSKYSLFKPVCIGGSTAYSPGQSFNVINPELTQGRWLSYYFKILLSDRR
jgi:hypothetical protein